MSIRSLRAGRQNYPPETYLGTKGELFYIEATGEFRVCDAVTPGGTPIPLALASQTVAGTVKLGPGVILNSEGQIIIDSEGLEFSFGNFQSIVGTYSDSTDFAILQTINTDEDAVIASNGAGAIKVLGEFEVYATNNTTLEALEQQEPILRVEANGQIRMLVPTADAVAGALEIIGNDSGDFHPPNQTGVILHTTGNTNTVNRVYHDAANNYPIIVGRRYNGVVGALTAVQDGEVFFRIAGQASTGSDFETFGPAKINWIATEDQGPNNQGGKITVDVTANGTDALNNVITALEITPEGIVSTVGFIGGLTGNATTATNLAAATDILAGTISIDPAVINRDTASIQTFTLTGLTTNHKIVVTSGTALGYALFISAAWASDADTLSIEFQNLRGNQDVDLPLIDIQYFAWV